MTLLHHLYFAIFLKFNTTNHKLLTVEWRKPVVWWTWGRRVLQQVSCWKKKIKQQGKIDKTLVLIHVTLPWCSETFYDHPVNTTTLLLQSLFCGPHKSSIIFLTENLINLSPSLMPPTVTLYLPLIQVAHISTSINNTASFKKHFCSWLSAAIQRKS